MSVASLDHEKKELFAFCNKSTQKLALKVIIGLLFSLSHRPKVMQISGGHFCVSVLLRGLLLSSGLVRRQADLQHDGRVRASAQLETFAQTLEAGHLLYQRKEVKVAQDHG